MEKKPKFAVIGGGSWATAIAKMLCENQDEIAWYMRSTYAIEHLKHQKHNPNYLSSVAFDTNKLKLTNDINEAVAYADYIIFVVPSAFLSKELESLTESLEGKIIFSAIKGIVPESSLIVGEHFHTKYNIPFENIGVITGPCHAEEVAMERLSYLTIATAEKENIDVLRELFASDYIKVSCSKDILGNEYSAILKNIYAIGAGIASGLGYGDNFQAVFVSNAIREMELFLDAVYPETRDVNESAYLGDLLVTAYSLFSRNRNLGNLIGKGYTVKSAVQSMSMVAEGYYATRGIYEIAYEKKLKTPIINAIFSVLYEGKDAEKQFEKLTAKLN